MLLQADEGDETQIIGKLSAPVKVQVEPIGRWYEALCQRRRHKHSTSYCSESSSSEEDEEELSEEENDDESLLLGLDPTDWKSQDHYAVLGLKKSRYRASFDQIKRAYKRKVLKHHPDKRKARGLAVKDGDDDYFTCITRAYEILGVRAKRRSYDSVDPTFDDIVPPVNTNSKENFFQVFGPVFEANSRWSNKKKIPQLGKIDASFDDVNDFYSFWYEFDSWREYSYLDEEEKEKGENRDERRWIEKQNKAARQKRKKEEVARIRQIVDNAYACDPRVQKFKDEEKQRKLAEKKARQDAIKKKLEAEEKIRQEALEEERKQREKEEEEAKAQAAAIKKEKDIQKKALKKERKTLRTVMKEMEYFSSDEKEKVDNMSEVDRLAELLSLISLQKLNENLTSGDRERAKTAFHDQVKELNDQIEKEKQQQMEAIQKQSSGESSQKGGKHWSDEELAGLIKAVNLFPSGTKDRWEVISNFLSQHCQNSNKSAKDVLAKTKELQKNDVSLREEAMKKAFRKFEKEHKAAPSAQINDISERDESVAEQQIRETGSNPAPWTADEQKSLEQALKTYPPSTPERWEKIAEVIPTRSKKDCMKRYKELCEIVRAKKAATEAAAKKK